MPRILFIILYLFVIFLVVVTYFYPYVKKMVKNKRFRQHMGRKIYKLANDNDYLLLQNYIIQVDKNSSVRFDHILFGNKYFYCITDKTWKGSIIGSNRDEYWLYYDKGSLEPQDIKNPLRVNQRRLEHFSRVTQVDKEMLINIVVVSDDSLCTCVGLRSETVYLCKESDFKKLIYELESRNVPPFDSHNLEEVVEQIYKISM